MRTSCRKYVAGFMAAFMLLNTGVCPLPANIVYADILPDDSDQTSADQEYSAGEEATASDAEENKDHQHSSSETSTMSDALYDEDGFLVDGIVETDIPEEVIQQEDILLPPLDKALPDPVIEEEEIIIFDDVEGPEIIWQDISELLDWDSDELLQDYFERQLKNGGSDPHETRKTPRSSRLTGNDAAVYAYAKNKIEMIAAGQLGYAEISLPLRLFNIPGYDEATNTITVTSEDVGAPLISSGSYSAEVQAYFSDLQQRASFDGSLVNQALLADCPYDFYWSNKWTGYTTGFGYSSTGNSKKITITVTQMPCVFYPVDPEFRASKDDELTVDTGKTSTASASAAKARRIVEEAKYRSDYEKLVYYRETICNLTTYNYDAVDAGGSTSYGTAGPWQVFYVFDENNGTNVVCEGYAKAFKYLCDLTNFNSSEIECSLVFGTLKTQLSDGNHMWNIVHMNDGKNYVADITNCDEGAEGSPDQLFLRGYTEQTTNGSGRQTGYIIKANGKNFRYAYDSDTLRLFTDREITIPGADYTGETVRVTGVTLDQTARTVGEGGIFFLTAAVAPASATNKSVSWSSSNNAVAVVDQNGRVTAVKAGTAVITVRTDDGSKTAACTVTVTSMNAAETFIRRLYRVCLDREADPGGLQNWLAAVRSGNVKGIQLAYSFVFSPEFEGKNYCDRHFMTYLYRALLGREPDSAGLANWVNVLRSGTKRETLLNQFASSAEYQNRCIAAGIDPGSIVAEPVYGTRPAGACAVCGEKSKVVQFVERMYQTCLGREPDAGGLADWTNKLYTGQIKGIQLAASFVFSPEFTGKNYCNTCFTTQLYRALLGREPDAGGLANWVYTLDTGVTRETLLNSFASSAEYNELCSEAGIELGEMIAGPQYGTQPLGACRSCGAKSKVVQFVERMYTKCLGRAGDTQGIANWSMSLYNHQNTAKNIVSGFFLSAEMTNKHLSNEEYVRRLYRTMLNREPDSVGFKNWVALLNSGQTVEAVIEGFVDSAEFTGLCNDYGVVRK